MSKELFRALDQDLERLLLAGGGVAATDDALASRKDKFAALAGKVPALGKVAEQIGKVTSAKARVASAELLTLGAMAAQLRAAQASPGGTEGALAPLPETLPMETPLGAAEIEPIFRALTTKGSGRGRVVEDAVERHLVRDLRLVDAWVGALADVELSGSVEEYALPELGDIVVPRLLAAFKMDGGGRDARRLGCLAKLQKEKAVPLLLRATEEGSSLVREAAVQQLAAIDFATAEPIVLRLAEKDASRTVRHACLELLGDSTRDEALALLLAQLRADGSHARRNAARALRVSKHPRAVESLLALATPEALDIKPYVPPKPKKGVKLTPAQQKAAEKEQREGYAKAGDEAEYVSVLLETLGSYDDPRAETVLLRVWKQGHKVDSVHGAAFDALAQRGSPAAKQAVREALDAKNEEIRDSAIEALLREPAAGYDALVPRFAPAALGTKPGVALADKVLSELSCKSKEEIDPRWGDLCLKLLGNATLRGEAIGVLKELEDRRALEPLVEKLDDKGAKNHLGEVLDALGSLKDKRATAPVVALLERKGFNDYWQVFDSLRELDDPAAVAPLRAWVEKKLKGMKKGAHEPWELRRAKEVLGYLERDRTLS